MTMRAVVCHAITPDLTGVEVRAVPTPSPGPGEALIRVRAASINFPDILMCQGRYQFKPDPPFTPGLDVAGDIVANPLAGLEGVAFAPRAGLAIAAQTQGRDDDWIGIEIHRWIPRFLYSFQAWKANTKFPTR
jgi:hypothetical protein